jgi:hypothetical protein
MARSIIGLVGVATLGSHTPYPELVFMIGALTLHWRGFTGLAVRARDAGSALWAERCLRMNPHAPVGIVDAFLAHQMLLGEARSDPQGIARRESEGRNDPRIIAARNARHSKGRDGVRALRRPVASALENF